MPIDGRILDVLRVSPIDGPLLIAPLILDELQQLADGSDAPRRTRGRRGLDILNQLRADFGDRLQMLELEKAAEFAAAVDKRLIRLAVTRQARLLTVDVGLQKRAQAAGVTVVNWNELIVAMKPPCLTGDKITLQIVRSGQQANQGVGYLEDSTIVVVEGAREHVDHTVHLTFTSVTQTAAGRMVFGRFDSKQSPRSGRRHYICSTTSIPKSDNPSLTVRAVKSQSFKRLSRSSGVGAFSTGHCSKNVE